MHISSLTVAFAAAALGVLAVTALLLAVTSPGTASSGMTVPMQTAAAVARTRYNRRRLRAWLFSNLIASVIPVLFIWWARSQEDLKAGFAEIFGNGDLMIISVVLILGAIGELYLEMRFGDFSGWHGATFTFAMGALVCGAGMYGYNLCFNCSDSTIHTKYPEWLANASVVTLVLAALVGTGSILLSSGEGTE